MAAARSPPPSEPANVEFLRPTASPRSRRSAALFDIQIRPLSKDPGEGRPAVQGVGEGLADLGPARDSRVLDAQPSLELADQRLRPLLPDCQAPLGRLAVDLTLDREQLVDAPDRLSREWRLRDR